MRLILLALAFAAAPATELLALPTSTPEASTATEIDARTLARTLADRLMGDFVYPEQGQRYAQMLRANADAGAYDALKGVELAARLGFDLQKVAPDGHLRVMYDGVGGGGGPQIIVKTAEGGSDELPPKGAQPVRIRMEMPPAIEHAGWIAPGVAYIRFNGFPGEANTVEETLAFMTAHADAKTIIFDLRTHHGGGLDEMDVIFPWLFKVPTHLLSMATRKSADEAGKSPITGVPTLRVSPPGPNFVTREHWVTPGKDRRLRNAKIYVLTSSFSASAAEHFALVFKRTGRGTLVGRTTYGANHFGGDQDLGGAFTAFIPVGRSYDPATGKDWEGAGVTPDIDVPAKDALVKALMLSGVPAAKATQLSAAVAPKGPMAMVMERERKPDLGPSPKS